MLITRPKYDICEERLFNDLRAELQTYRYFICHQCLKQLGRGDADCVPVFSQRFWMPVGSALNLAFIASKKIIASATV